ncbi:MAG: chemotaxis protein CheW [Pseudomonadota bacterium]
MPSSNKNSKEEAALVEYLDECTEMLERFSKNLSLMESGKVSPEMLASIYREMHTIKGNSQFFGFSQVGVLAHAMESSLDPVRKGTAAVTQLLVDGLYQGADVISTLLAGIRRDHKEPDLHKLVSDLVPRLVDLTSNIVPESKLPEPQVEKSEVSSDNVQLSKDLKENGMLAPVIGETQAQGGPEAEKPKEAEVEEEEIEGFVLFDNLPEHLKLPVAQPAASDSLESGNTSKVEDGQQSNFETTLKSGDQSVKSNGDEVQSETIRVQVALLDNLMNLVGELVLIRNQLLQHAKVNDSDSEFDKMSQRLNVLTAELQNEVMKTRMQPVGNVLNKFTRVVREMGRELGKKIELNIYGSETELDKTIIEAVKDPLTHIIRNAVDHGIELPADRKALGKQDTGRLNIKAHHESGQVIIEITDDGRGLDPKAIGTSAVNKRLITSDALAKMTDREIQFLIFAPGFSTAATVSSLSGRGVGMDVVKTNVERIGGMVDLASKPGTGTTVKLKIPLTLAIVPALIVKALNQSFAIPQSKLVELVRIDKSDSKSEKIEVLQGSPVLRLRGKILPLLNLSEVLTHRIQDNKNLNISPFDVGSVNIVILNADAFQFGLVVDAVEDTADIVVKSLSSFLKEITHFSGATIMGDGSVALTLDVMGISTSVRMTAESEAAGIGALGGFHDYRGRHQMDSSEFLMIDVGAPGSYVIPLTVVSRLEEFEEEDFELSGEQKVVRYRNSLLPIFSLPEFLHLPFSAVVARKEKTPVVVIRRGDSLFGVEVLQIQDVAAFPSTIDQTVRDRPGILGTMVADDHVLVVVDIFGMIDAVKLKLAVEAGVEASESDLGSGSSRKDIINKRRKTRILIVEDSSFFRTYMRQILEDAGYLTDTACDGLEGWSALENADPKHFSMVLSDIEMPGMTGLELARKISDDRKYSHLPLVAITTRFSGSDFERGRAAGFTRYLEKLNAEKLLTEVDELISQVSSMSESRKELKLASSN